MNVSDSDTIQTSPATRLDVEFPCEGGPIRAWHFTPRSDALRSSAGAPAVILGHGFGLTRDCGLEAYAERFAQAGMHAILFDYRGFGASGGELRDVTIVREQLADYLTVIGGTRELDGIDPDRIALWGTSYSGGLVVSAAAEDGRIAAIVSQVPNLDNLATLRFLTFRRTPMQQLRQVGWITRDVIRGLRGREPYYVTANGKDGENAAYASTEAWEQIAKIRGESWNNRVALRDFARLPMFRAIKDLPRVNCRIQFFACDRDNLTPAKPAIDAAAKLGDRAELHVYHAGHFGIYVEPIFSEALEAQAAFLVGELATSARAHG